MASQRRTKKDPLMVADSGAKQAPGRRMRAATGPRRRRLDSTPRSLFERLRSVVGKAKGLPPDAASNHDHYLYGLPRK
jgi:hypothetical protein